MVTGSKILSWYEPDSGLLLNFQSKKLSSDDLISDQASLKPGPLSRLESQSCYLALLKWRHNSFQKSFVRINELMRVKQLE